MGRSGDKQTAKRRRQLIAVKPRRARANAMSVEVFVHADFL
jgi:hypothetical protein